VHNDFLFTVSEIAVAFAGFAGLVVAISRRNGRSAEQALWDLQHLKNVLGTSLLAIAFALLPAMLSGMGADVAFAWRSSALLFAIAWVGYAGNAVPKGLSAYRAIERAVPLTYWISVVLSVFVPIALVLCAAGVLPTSTYLPALAFLLYGSGASFVRVFISVARDETAV
jgi:hypothetical protein